MKSSARRLKGIPSRMLAPNIALGPGAMRGHHHQQLVMGSARLKPPSLHQTRGGSRGRLAAGERRWPDLRGGVLRPAPSVLGPHWFHTRRLLWMLLKASFLEGGVVPWKAQAGLVVSDFMSPQRPLMYGGAAIRNRTFGMHKAAGQRHKDSAGWLGRQLDAGLTGCRLR